MLIAACVIAGALIWFVPFLTAKRTFVADVPAPPALFTLAQVTVPARGQACLGDVTVEPSVRFAQFTVRPASPSPRGGPPLALTLQASGYRSATLLGGGYPGGAAQLAIAPPRRAVIGTACISNRGRAPLLLNGSAEARTLSRSPLTVNARLIPGEDFTLELIDGANRSLIDDLGTVFAHASRLTDGLVPVWLVWAIAILAALGVPLGVIASYYRSLREAEAPAA